MAKTFLIYQENSAEHPVALLSSATNDDLRIYSKRVEVNKVLGDHIRNTPHRALFERGSIYLDTPDMKSDTYKDWVDDVRKHILVEGVNAKKCKKCGKLLPYSQFYNNATLKDGKANTCKECKSKESKALNAKKKTNQPPKTLSLSDFEDTSLFSELKRRGYAGELKFAKTVCI